MHGAMPTSAAHRQRGAGGDGAAFAVRQDEGAAADPSRHLDHHASAVPIAGDAHAEAATDRMQIGVEIADISQLWA